MARREPIEGKAQVENRPRPRATLRDVARMAGVSHQTVSNYINGRVDQMSTATQHKLERVMRDLEYHPNRAARGLRSARSETLGFLVVDDAAHFLADPMTDLFLAGLGDVLREREYSLLVHSVSSETMVEPLLAPVHERRLDGAVFLLSGPQEERSRWFTTLSELDIPILLLQEHSGGGFPAVSAEDRRGGRGLCEHLIRSGHTRIAFITAERHWSAIEERLEGFLDAHRAAGLEHDPRYIRWQGDFDPLDGAAITDELLALEPRPSAVLCGNDLIALGVVKAARERGLRIPADLAVTGFDDFNFAVAAHPPLTTVRIPGYEMGRYAAVELLEAAADGRPPVGKRFPTEVCIRQSA
jgi:DNA-binding LacI/PurR family transcriptional regulator